MSNFVEHIYEEHMVTRQNKAEKAFLEEFEKAQPSLDEAHVLVNPYLANPLCALILFKTKTQVEATLTIHGKNNTRENIIHKFGKNTSHAVPVVGLYDGIETKVSIELSSGEKKEFKIKGQELAKNVMRCRNVNTSQDYFGTDLMFLSPADKSAPVGYDYTGEVRWCLTIPTMFDLKRLQNGNIMTGSYRYSRMPYHSTGIVEINLLGKIVKEYRMPGNSHHDQVELSDGNIMACTQDFATDTVEDMMALIDRETGKVLRTWDYKDLLPQNVGGSGSQDAHDWFHNNALWVDEKNKTVTLSGRHQDAVINFSYEENGGKGKLNWIIGDPEGWPKEMVDKYFFTPKAGQKDFDWQYEQHACLLTPSGDVMCFDNGHYRAKTKEKYIENKDNFSRGVRYKIDTNKMEIEQVWQYGKELGQSFFSPYICNVEYYNEGHYLIHSGGIGSIDGYASKALPAYLNPNDEGVIVHSKTVEEKDGVVLYYLEVDGNFYRAERLPIYHNKENLVFGEGKVVGELDITPEFGTIPDVEEVMEIVPAELKISIAEEEDKIVFTGTYERGSLTMIVLEGKDDAHGYYVITTAVHHLAMCSGVFLENDERTVKYSISKRGLKGKYDVKLVYNDKKYQTGVSLYC